MTISIDIEEVTGLNEVLAAAEATTHGQPVRAPLRLWYKTKHSPVRARLFAITFTGLKTKVSVHFVRHKIGVDHFVQTMRNDRGGPGDDGVTRNTPVTHRMLINAEAVMNISAKRLCYNADRDTVAAWMKVRRHMKDVDSALASWMVPECVRVGYCPEFRECGPGVVKVMKAYASSAPSILRKENDSLLRQSIDAEDEDTHL